MRSTAWSRSRSTFSECSERARPARGTPERKSTWVPGEPVRRDPHGASTRWDVAHDARVGRRGRSGGGLVQHGARTFEGARHRHGSSRVAARRRPERPVSLGERERYGALHRGGAPTSRSIISHRSTWARSATHTVRPTRSASRSRSSRSASRATGSSEALRHAHGVHRRKVARGREPRRSRVARAEDVSGRGSEVELHRLA